MAFTPLDVQSSFSLLQGPIRIPDLVKAAKERGYTALALTDENILYGVVDFYNAAREAGIKPLLGMKMRLALGTETGASLMVTFLARNRQGYRHLMDLSTRHQTTPHDQLPLTVDQVADLLGDLFVIVPPQTGMFTPALQPAKFLAQLAELTDPDGLLIGVNPDLDAVHRETLRDLASSQGLALVGSRPVEYLDPTDQFATKVLQAVRSGGQLENVAAQARERGRITCGLPIKKLRPILWRGWARPRHKRPAWLTNVTLSWSSRPRSCRTLSPRTLRVPRTSCGPSVNGDWPSDRLPRDFLSRITRPGLTTSSA